MLSNALQVKIVCPRRTLSTRCRPLSTTLPNPLPLPLYKSTDRAQMGADVVRLIGGGRDVCIAKHRRSDDGADQTPAAPARPDAVERALRGAAVQQTAQYAHTALSLVAAQLQWQRHAARSNTAHGFCG